MMPHQTTKRKTRRSPGRRRGCSTRFPGICADAAALGVNRASLYRMLTGEWQLPALKKRYEALKAGRDAR